jgi:hypothetical protein
MSINVRWLSVFADVPTAWTERSLRYWSAITGAAPGTPTGDDVEFHPLVPSAADGYLFLQSVQRDVGGWHPDFYVADLEWAHHEAVACGARLVQATSSLAAFESPAGQPFCLFADSGPARIRPPAPTWPHVGRSLADQLCFDIPFDAFESELAFWSVLTGWPHVSGGTEHFARINPPRTLPIQLLLQRLGHDDDGGSRAHLDISADEPDAEVARHVGLGATVQSDDHAQWTTLRDPAGLVYCVTRRQPYQPMR